MKSPSPSLSQSLIHRRGTPRTHTRTGAATAAIAVAALCVVSGAGTASAAPAPASAAAPAARASAAHTTAAHTRATTTDSGKPGDLIGAGEPTAFRVLPGVPTLTHAWKITYHSTDATGAANTDTGTVIVPSDGHTGTRPLLTYAVGTVGMADKCAPSATFPQGTTQEAALIEAALLRGWAVAVTDYEGLGTPAPHTYTVGRPEGTAMLDAARAAERLPEAQQSGVSAQSPVGIMGYSQGGQASAWAAQLQSSYAPDLNVKGSASGGVPADLRKVAAYDDGGANAGLILMSALGHDAAYPQLKLDSYLTDDGKKLADSMRNSCLEEITAAGANKSITDVTVRNPLDQPDWKARIDADKLGNVAPAHPAFLYHGGSDEIIPYQVGRQLRADWCARGVPVEFHTVPLAQHVGAAVLGAVPAMNWLADRFADKPAKGNCDA